MTTLLVIHSDRISEWIDKGEVVDRYYNPENAFDELHLLLTNGDTPDTAAIQRLAGRARVHVHNMPSDRLLPRTLGYRPQLLRRWAAKAVALAHELTPDLVRCFGAHVNLFCALEIRRALGIPVVASLHTLPGDPAGPPPRGAIERVDVRASRALAERGLRDADVVLAVYASLVPYLTRLGSRRVELAYNAVGGDAVRVKNDYALRGPPRLISVGRQIPGKDPMPLVEAVAALEDMRLLLVGDGPLHDMLCARVDALGAADRIEFRRAMANDELIASLNEYDVFAARNDYDGAPKAVLEPMLAGLPVLLNRNDVPELDEAVCLHVEPTAAGFRRGLSQLLADRAMRERLGRAARERAERLWSAEAAERRVLAVYRELLAARGTSLAAQRMAAR